jgi:hypothetical protein
VKEAAYLVNGGIGKRRGSVTSPEDLRCQGRNFSTLALMPKDKMGRRRSGSLLQKVGLDRGGLPQSQDRATRTLEGRPVYHKTDDRIKIHVFLCTLADYLQWHLKKRLEPLFAADGTHKYRQ